MSNSPTSKLVSLRSVFVVCWLVSTVFLTSLVDWRISVELHPGYWMEKDRASWPFRVFLGLLFGAIESGAVVGLLVLWRKMPRSHAHETNLNESLKANV